MRVLLAFSISIVASSTHAGATQYKSASANMAPGCNIRLQVPSDARVTSSPENQGSGGITVPNPRHLVSKEYIEPFYLGFSCYDENAKIVGAGPVKFNEKKKKWVRYFPNRLKGEGVEYSNEENLELDRAIHFFELAAVNAQGYAYTEDDIIGEESGRLRKLHYCLIHPPKAVCGDGDMGYLVDGPKGDLTRYALKILSGIEFLNEAAPTVSNPSP